MELAALMKNRVLHIDPRIHLSCGTSFHLADSQQEQAQVPIQQFFPIWNISPFCLVETPDNSTKNTPCPLELGTTLPSMKIHIRTVLGVPPPFLALVALFLPPLDPSFLSPVGGPQFLPAAAPYVTPVQTSGALKLRQVHCQWMTWKHGRENKIISFRMEG